MPQYEFFCKKCEKIFTVFLTLAEYDKGEFVCPHCKSKNVEQRPAAFQVVTSKKS
jgi:putative FmdB family regulatory protein